MAEFSITLTNKRGATVLTKYDILTHETTGLTFDENLNLNIEGPTLSFSMLKYLYEGSRKVINTAALSINYGSVIQLVVNSHRYDFAITGINYQFMPENLQLNFDSLNLFQFENQQVGIGYTISADTTDPLFLGARPIDWWVNKILNENNVGWEYIDIDTANREILNNLNTDYMNEIRTNTNDESTWLEISKTKYSTLNTAVSFECSDSNVYNALKLLADNNDLFIVVDYSARNFWFTPKQNPVFNGYYFNPYNNLQNFSLRGKGDNLITVLNVTGPNDVNNQEITLVPSIPGEILNFINSDQWMTSIFSPDLYNQYDTNSAFVAQAIVVPWLENKLINIDFFKTSFLLPSEQKDIQQQLYNNLRIVNGRLIADEQNYMIQYEKDYMAINQDFIDLERLNAEAVADISGNIESYLDNWDQNIQQPFFINDLHGKWICYPQEVQRVVVESDNYRENINRSTSINDSYITALSRNYNRDSITFNFGASAEIDGEPVLFYTTSSYSNEMSFFSQVQLCKASVKDVSSRHNIVFPAKVDECELEIYPTIHIVYQYESRLAPEDPPTIITRDYVYYYDNNRWTTDESAKILFNPYATQPSAIPVQVFSIDNKIQIATSFACSDSHKYFGALKYSILSEDPTVKVLYCVMECVGQFEVKSATTSPYFDCEFTPSTITITNYSSQILYYGYSLTNSLVPNASITLNNEHAPTFIFKFNTPAQRQLGQLPILIKQTPITLTAYTENGEQYGDTITITDVDTTQIPTINSLLSHQQYQQNLLVKQTGDIAGLDEQLTSHCGRNQSLFSLLLQNLTNFKKYWEEVGLFYCNYNHINLLPEPEFDNIAIGQPWSTVSPYDQVLITSDDIVEFQRYVWDSHNPVFARQNLIQYCYGIKTKLTEYWKGAYDAANALGIYLPDSWNSLSLLENPNLNYAYRIFFNILIGGIYDDLTYRWSQAPELNQRLVPVQNLIAQTGNNINFKFYDDNNIIKLPVQNLQVSNTQPYFTLVQNNDDQDYYFAKNIADWSILRNDNLNLYQERTAYNTKIYVAPINAFKTAATTLYDFVYIGTEYEGSKIININLDYLKWLVRCNLYNRQRYYENLQKHNDIWLYLHHNYPGVFRESVYTCNDVVNAQQLYEAARAELDQLSKPAFEYSLTGMDIYAYDMNYLPTKIKLGEQIRIDYQEEMELNNTLNDALREPLYITGITHTLRNDGDYQFTVTTRAANNTMIQRFAQLLNFGR